MFGGSMELFGLKRISLGAGGHGVGTSRFKRRFFWRSGLWRWDGIEVNNQLEAFGGW